MDKVLENKLGIMCHIYDYLHGGYFASHNQLAFYDGNVFNYYINKDKNALLKKYDELKQQVPSFIVKSIEKSAGIRYFICDSCHDAQIKGVEYGSGNLIININTEGMLGCLNLIDTECKIIAKVSSKQSIDELLIDFNNFERMFWISNDIICDNNEIYFVLELQGFKGRIHENIHYKFKISDIIVK